MGGTTWNNITTNLPSIGAHCVQYEGDEDDGIESDQVVVANVNVDYDSGTSIELLNGFEVRTGSNYHAFINGCGNLIIGEIAAEEK